MSLDAYDYKFLGILAALAALVVALIFVAVENDRQWQAFKAEHNCKAVAHIKGDVFNTVGVGVNGKMVVGVGTTPSKTGWKCDDGMTYFR